MKYGSEETLKSLLSLRNLSEILVSPGIFVRILGSLRSLKDLMESRNPVGISKIPESCTKIVGADPSNFAYRIVT